MSFLAHRLRSAGGGGGWLTYIGAGHLIAAPNGDVDVPVPAHEAGDLLLARFLTRDNGGQAWSPTEAGWTELFSGKSAGNPSDIPTDPGIFWRIAGGGEPASYKFTYAGGKNPDGGAIFAFRGATSASFVEGEMVSGTNGIDLQSAAIAPPAGSVPIAFGGVYFNAGFPAETLTLAGDAEAGVRLFGVVDASVSRLALVAQQLTDADTSVAASTGGIISTNFAITIVYLQK